MLQDDRLTAIRLKQQNGQYGPQIPVSDKSQNIKYKNTQYNLDEVLGNVKTNVGPLQDQINNITTDTIQAALEDRLDEWKQQEQIPVTSVTVDPFLTMAGDAADAQQAGKVITINSETDGNATKLHLNTTNDTINVALMEDLDNLSNVIAEEFVTNKAYKIDQYVIYDGNLYKFISAHSAGAWNSSQAMQVKISDEITNTINNVDELKDVATFNGFRISNISDILNKNRFNGRTVDGYLNSDGTIHANGSGMYWAITDYVYVEDLSAICISAKAANNTRYQRSFFFMCTYDKDRNFIGQKSTITTYSVESGVCYIRTCLQLNDNSDIQIESGSVITPYTPYNYEIIPDNIKEFDDKFYYYPGKNMLNTSVLIDGYLNANGSIHANTSQTDWVTTDFIDVSGTNYIDTSKKSGNARTNLGAYFLLNYDSSKQIVGSQINNAPNPYAIPNTVKYIRFSYHLASEEPMVEKGQSMTSYEPYVEYTGVTGMKQDTTSSRYVNLKWAVFGDSLTEKNTRAAISYYDYVADELGCEIINYGMSGTGYARTNSNFMVRMLNINPDDFDVLTIFGSFNDAGAGLDIGTPTDSGTSTLCGCINTTIDNFYSVAPYKVIGLVTPCPWATIPPNNTWGQNYVDAIIAIGKLRGIPVLDLFRKSGIRPWAGAAYLAEYYTENGVADEGVHPNSKGHKVFLYPHFRQFVKELF